ncbi:Sulfhydrogenase 1 subunit gamma [uncultured archaeon]|nr:Sulfhydrogenase 1 subunit gamma [uncultured archaeon]
MERKIFTIAGVERNGGEIKVFTLSPDDGKNITFKAGQFAMLFQLEGNNFGKLSRPYSIASSPLEPELRFAIKMTGGQFTSILDKMKPGEQLGVAAPFGHFAYEGEDKVIFLAAGTGVAPMLGMLEYIAQAKKTGRFTLVYSSKREEWIGCMPALGRLQAANPGIKVIYTLTQEQPASWKGELGRINEKMVAKHADYAKDAAVFVCGPVEFSKTMKETMLKLGAEEKKIKVEAWG